MITGENVAQNRGSRKKNSSIVEESPPMWEKCWVIRWERHSAPVKMLIAGRLAGWLLVALALLMVSGDAVLALGSGEHVGIVAGDLWMLLAGHAPRTGTAASFGAMLMAWPAWAAIGPVGIVLVAVCRPHRRRVRYRRLD